MTDKEKQIQEMAKELHCATNESFISCRKIARILVERRGYGNVKQAVKEFTETLRKKAKLLYEPNREWYENVRVNEIDDLIVELYGADE